ncbi:hypothetical protein [Roseospira goensis]|uniref:Uncharacterized protein n=1 Tax=Roseospira goensis TaxID=391922 RepID=A0A7W6S2R3_9PROT|nr:hypothetical protein [Roseospira goensis]MBB4287826.1 hypothetical protein [Roseospira goensis]
MSPPSAVTLPRRLCVGYPSYQRVAAWSATSAAPDCPAALLGTLPYADRWRAATPDPADGVLTGVLPRLTQIRAVALLHHDCPPGARLTVTAYRDAALSTVAWASGALPMWPAVYGQSGLPFEDPRWWTLTYSADELAGRRWHRVVILPRALAVRAVRVAITPAPGQTTVRVGGVEVCDLLEAAGNYDWGAEPGRRSLSSVAVTEAGGVHAVARPAVEVWTGALRYQPEDHALAAWSEYAKAHDIVLPALLIPHPRLTRHLLREVFPARLLELPRWTVATAGRRRSWTLRYEEHL